ncbi:hypothetical protein AVEN_26568-1 [Araneus ventricosus]|uniref:Uncharacterized protein n=1 Tax=Araneus ventricosus TaxID=182803 RepID=A0A4Y2FR66_ARAVE|nr:hypothetical protein AVEN_26568-1 [Araneus ventricosus]
MTGTAPRLAPPLQLPHQANRRTFGPLKILIAATIPRRCHHLIKIHVAVSLLLAITRRPAPRRGSNLFTSLHTTLPQPYRRITVFSHSPHVPAQTNTLSRKSRMPVSAMTKKMAENVVGKKRAKNHLGNRGDERYLTVGDRELFT